MHTHSLSFLININIIAPQKAVKIIIPISQSHQLLNPIMSIHVLTGCQFLYIPDSTENSCDLKYPLKGSQEPTGTLYYSFISLFKTYNYIFVCTDSVPGLCYLQTTGSTVTVAVSIFVHEYVHNVYTQCLAHSHCIGLTHYNAKKLFWLKEGNGQHVFIGKFGKFSCLNRILKNGQNFVKYVGVRAVQPQ